MCWKKWQFSTALALAIVVFLGPLSVVVASEGNTAFGGEFTLSAVDGPVKLSDLKGKVVLLFFGYTSCPDICPLSLARIGACLTSLEPAQTDEVRALFITLDPERDTPERMREYARFFHPNILGLTGGLREIDTITTQYGIEYKRKPMPDSALGYTISHPTVILVVDAEGKLVGRVQDEEGVEVLRETVLELLARQP